MSKDKKFFEMLKQEDRRVGPGFDINLLIHYLFFGHLLIIFFVSLAMKRHRNPLRFVRIGAFFLRVFTLLII